MSGETPVSGEKVEAEASRDEWKARALAAEATAERYRQNHERMRDNERRVHDALRKFERPFGVPAWDVAAEWVTRAEKAEAERDRLEVYFNATLRAARAALSPSPPETEEQT